MLSCKLFKHICKIFYWQNKHVQHFTSVIKFRYLKAQCGISAGGCLSIKIMKTKDIVWLHHEVVWNYEVYLFSCQWLLQTKINDCSKSQSHLFKLYLCYVQSRFRLTSSSSELCYSRSWWQATKWNKPILWIKLQSLLSLNIVGKMRENLSTQLNKIYNKD